MKTKRVGLIDKQKTTEFSLRMPGLVNKNVVAESISKKSISLSGMATS